MHVLLVPSFYPTRERPVQGIFFETQARALESAGLTVGVVFPELRSLRQARMLALRDSHFQVEIAVERGLKVVRQRGWNPMAQTVLGGRVWSALVKRLVQRYIRKYGRPDVLHAHNAVWGGIAAVAIGQQLRIPVVVTEHSSQVLNEALSDSQRRAVVKCYNGAAKLLAVSGALQASIVKGFHGAHPTVLPNVIDTDFFAVRDRERTGENIHFLSVAHLTANKGFDILLRAFAYRFRSAPWVRLSIGGGGEEAGNLKSLVAELQIESQVTFLGPLSPAGVRDAMWRSDCFVLASHRETFGVVLGEALSTGLPVIATNSGGPSDVVTPDVGILVAPGDVAGLGDAMVRVATGEFTATAAGCRSIAVGRYSPRTIAKQLTAVYEEAAAQPPASAQ